MEELKVQNGLLLQLINSKNRQNQILFQQYDQLAADNRLLQVQADQLRNTNNQLKRQLGPNASQENIASSPFLQEVAELKKKQTELNGIIVRLKTQLEQQGGTVILLQEELQAAKLQAIPNPGESQQILQAQKGKIMQLEDLLLKKQEQLAGLTEQMGVQAEKITELTQSHITAINNYEGKLAQKDIHLQTVTNEISQLKQQLAEQSSATSGKGLKDNQKIQQLQTIIASKEQSIQELSEFLQQQTDKIIQQQKALAQNDATHLQQQIGNLNQIIISKQQSIADLSEFLNSLTANNSQMEQKMASLQSELQQKRHQLAQKQNQSQEKWNVIVTLRQLIAFQQAKIAQLTAKNAESDTLQRENEIIRTHLSTKQDQLSRLRDQIQEKNAEMSVLRTQLDQKILKITMFQSLSEQNDADFPNDKPPEVGLLSKSKEKEDYQELLQIKTEEVQSLKATIEQKELSLRDFTDFISQQTDKIIQLEKIVHKQQEEESSPLQEELSALRARVFQLQNGMLLAQNDENNHKVSELQAIVAVKQQSNSQLATFLEEAYAKNAEIQANLQISQKSLQSANEQLTNIKIKGDSQKEIMQTDDKTSNVAIEQQLRNHIIELENALASKNDTIAQLTDFMGQQAEELQQLRQPQNSQQLNTIAQQLQDVLKTKTETIAELSQFMNQQSLRIQQLEEDLRRATNTAKNGAFFEELQQIIKAKEASVAELSDFLQQSYAQNAELQQALLVSQNQRPALLQEESQLKAQSEPYQSDALLEQKQSILNELNCQIEQKIASLEQINSHLQQAYKTAEQYTYKIGNLKTQLEEATSSYNTQIDQFNLHRQSLETQLLNSSEALQELVTQIQECQKVHAKLEQDIGILKEELSQSQQVRKQSLKASNSSKRSGVKGRQNQGGSVEVELGALKGKIIQYEGYLNEREEEMAAMMEVMEKLQAEIKAKNDLIEQLSSKQIENTAKLQIRQEKMQIEQQLRGDSQKLLKNYQKQLSNIMLGEAQLEKELNLDENPQQENNQQQIDNNEELTVLQVIEQILVYSQQSDFESILRMMEVLKRSYLNQNKCILKENSEFQETIDKLLQINNKLVEQAEKLKEESQDNHTLVTQLRLNIRLGQERIAKLESNYQQQIKTLRKSISALREESPIASKDAHSDLSAISRLEEEVAALRQENRQKQSQLEQLRANSNRKFVKELNNLLDSCSVPKEGQEIREMEEELERVTAERDQAVNKCIQYEQSLTQLQNQCAELTSVLEIAKNQQAVQNVQGQKHIDTAKLLAGIEAEPANNARPSDMKEELEKWRSQNEELHALLQEKNTAITQLQETMLGLEKGYNTEIISLRKNIAELKGEAIALKKSLYQANPNGVDVIELIKDTFSQSDNDTEFFRPAFPTYSNSLYIAQHNSSYYSDAQQPSRLSNPQQYQKYFAPQNLTMGEKFMGRRCRQGSPFGSFVEASRATAWEGPLQRY